jgi:hypothetical protein
LESSEGLGRLSNRATTWRKKYSETPELNDREKVRRFLSDVIEESDRHFISVLAGICEVKSKMGAHDKLIYCRKEGDLKSDFGRFFIVRYGKIREEVFTLPCTWGIGNQAMWSDLLDTNNAK